MDGGRAIDAGERAEIADEDIAPGLEIGAEIGDGAHAQPQEPPVAVEPKLVGAGCTIVLDLALGEGSASYLTSDLSYDYVRINAEYRS